MSSNARSVDMVPHLTSDLIPNIVDRRAKDQPEMLYAEYPVSASTYSAGYRKITYKDLANAVNGAAWWIHDTLGPSNDHEMLAYIGPNDLRYPVLILGAVKAGYVMFLTSTRNSVAAHISLLNRLGCKNLLTPSVRPPAVTAILAEYDICTREIPSVESLLEKTYAHFPYQRGVLEGLSDPLFAVHTSGSTGLPKPIVYTHNTAAMIISMSSLDPLPGFESLNRMYQSKRLFLTFPPFHGAYLSGHFFMAIPFGAVMITPTSATIPSAEGLVESLEQTPADLAFLVPSIVQELGQGPELLEFCSKNLKAIVYCGGDLPMSIGNRVASKIPLFNQFGATELGLMAQIIPKENWGPEDWKYAQFHPETGIEFREVSDNIYELNVVRDPEKAGLQPTFTLFPELDVYPTRDLFIRNPSKDKQDLWSWHARADDIIVFLNGEKTNPISMEQYIVSESSKITAALVAGAQRFQAALLVEPTNYQNEMSVTERAAFIEEIWPTIEAANRDCPAHARIFKTHVLLTLPRKPMPRTPKGTVQRGKTLRLYQTELDSLYTDAATMLAEEADGNNGATINIKDEHAVSQFIMAIILSNSTLSILDEDDNFFDVGLDSLQTLLLVRKLKRSLRMPDISPTMVYTNPSVNALTQAVLKHSRSKGESEIAQHQTRQQRLNNVLEDYKHKINGISKASTKLKEADAHVVILTGSTGALGSHILDALLTSPAIKHVYCLNRAANSAALQKTRNHTYGLETQIETSRVTFLTADLAQSFLGLQQEIFVNLIGTATLVIHNAWPVNFNLSLQTFFPQLDGLVNLISFTAEAASSPRLFFVSSISSAVSYSLPLVPEEVIADHSAPGPTGYAESKYVSEHLLDHAAQTLAIKTSFARVGQIAGPVHHPGLWNKAEWFPSLVLSSLHVGAITNSLGAMGSIDWVPIDILAELLVELAMVVSSETTSRRAEVFHTANPHSTNWEHVRPIIIDALTDITTKQPLETIAPSAWLTAVRKDIESVAGSHRATKDEDFGALLQANPAVKLLDFYKDVLGREDGANLSWEVRKSMQASEKMKTLEVVQPEWIRKWVGEWLRSTPEPRPQAR